MKVADEKLTVEERYLKSQDKKISKQAKMITKQDIIIKEFSEMQNVTQNFTIEAPYAHAKITVVKGGRAPKTEISLSIGGALDQMSFPDMKTHSESLLRILNEKIEKAMSKLTTEE